MPTSLIWVISPLLEEPSAAALEAFTRSSLFAHADQLARARTGAGVLTQVSPSPAADWTRARLRALSACLVLARARLLDHSAPRGVAGIGLGEVAALALSGLMRDEDALVVMVELGLALSTESAGIALLAYDVPGTLSARGVELSRLGECEVLAEGDAASMGAVLSHLHRVGARVGQPWPGPARAAARARASRAALAQVAAGEPSTIGFLRTDSAQWEHKLPAELSSEPFDLVRLMRVAARLGCTGHERIDGSAEQEAPPARIEATRSEPTPGYYLGSVRERSETSFVSERVLSLELEPYLATAARLHKTSVLPGSFELEIGIEAGKFLHPELVPVQIENALFHSALKLFKGQPATMRLKAASRPLGDGRHSVALSITSDLVHKSGSLLQADRKHCDMTVVMGPRYEAAPALTEFAEAESVADPDVPAVLYQPGSPLWLGPYFEAVWDTRRAGKVVRSVYRNPADLSLAAFGQHMGAPCLMDAVLQNPLRACGPYLAVGIPDSIRRVRFFGLLNEREIVRRHGHLILTSVVDDDLPCCELMQVSTPDGQVILEVEGFALIPLGWIDRRDLSVHPEVPVQARAPEPSLRALRV